MRTTVIAASATFAPTSYARARLLRALHGGGLLRAADSLTDRSLTDRSLTDRTLTDRALTDRALTDRSLTDRAGTGRPYGAAARRRDRQ